MEKNKKKMLKKEEKDLQINRNRDKISSKECLTKNEKDKKGKCKMATLTANCDVAFVVDKEKTNEFLNVKPNEKIRNAQKEIAKQILKNIIIESQDDANAKDK